MIKIHILGFIRTIHSNKHDFIEELYDAEFFGDIGMTFKKESGQVMGVVTAKIKSEDRKLIYVFNEKGYELLDDLMELSQDPNEDITEFNDSFLDEDFN